MKIINPKKKKKKKLQTIFVLKNKTDNLNNKQLLYIAKNPLLSNTSVFLFNIVFII
jgi:hypothetical protein